MFLWTVTGQMIPFDGWIDWLSYLIELAPRPKDQLIDARKHWFGITKFE